MNVKSGWVERGRKGERENGWMITNNEAGIIKF